jgi:hypothetical protein
MVCKPRHYDTANRATIVCKPRHADTANRATIGLCDTANRATLVCKPDLADPTNRSRIGICDTANRVKIHSFPSQGAGQPLECSLVPASFEDLFRDLFQKHMKGARGCVKIGRFAAGRFP